MASVNPPVLNFSGGIIGGELHNRVDIPTYPQGAEIMTNFRPTLQGVMLRRPPMVHVDDFADHTLEGELFPFVYSTEQSYLVLATTSGFSFYANDGLITIPAVTSALAAAASTAFTDQADSATITASSTDGGNVVANLVDESSTTYWASTGTGTETLTFDMGSAVTLKSLWLSADATYYQHVPTSFTMLGSATGAWAGEEVTLLTVSGASAFAANERRKYRFTASGSYRYYRLRMTANAAASNYVIAELSLFNSDYMDQSASPSAVSITGTNIFLDGDGANYATLEIPLSVVETNTRHVLAFEITHGPIDIRIGTTSGGSSLMSYTRLRAGIHRLAFTPTASTVYIQFRHNGNAGRIIKNTISILTGTGYSLPCPFLEDDLPEVHVQQIRDVLYMVHNDYWPRRLERRGDHSWSIVKLLPDDGPFGDTNTTNTTLAGSASTGEITLTASEDLFTTDDEGVLYSITGSGQLKTATATAADTYTGGIRVTGIGSASRSFVLEITGTFVATVTLQRSSGNENSYTDWQTYTSPTTVSVNDAQDNQTWYYRLAVKPGNYTSGTVVMTLTYAGGSTTGIVRVTQYISATSAIAEVIENNYLSSTSAVRTWKRGAWNVTDGFPNAITDGFGRLWFGRGSQVWASKSDDFTSFESVADEDDSSFSRNMATPSSDAIRWMARLAHLIVGTSAIEQVGLGNTNSEPIGPSNFQFLPGSEEGGAYIQPIEAGGSILFVHRNRRQLMQFTQNPKALSETSYISVDLTARAPEILDAKIVDIAVQREPERRIYVVLESGRLVELLFRREGELDVVAWSVVQTSGRVERVTVLPREDEDIVYFIVRRRNSSGTWQRFIERFGAERVLMDCDRYHLDAALGYELTKPEITITPSATTGSITITADADAFVVGDIGNVIWLNGGRGTITARASATSITVTVTSELDSTAPCPPLRWGMKATTSTLTGLSHLEGQTVRVWGDMTDLGTATVSSGSITLPQAVSVAYAGLAHTSRWKSLKMAYGAQKGTALGMRKAIKAIIILLYKCGGALTYGKAIGTGLARSFTKMRAVPTRTPAVPYGEPVPLFTGEAEHAFDAHYDKDSRLCFEIEGPAPCIIGGYVPILDEKDR